MLVVCSSALMDVAQLARMVFHARYLGMSSSFAYYPESLRVFKHKHDLTRQATRFIRIEETTVNSILDGSWDVTDSRCGHEQTSRTRAQHGLPERICFQKPQPIACSLRGPPPTRVGQNIVPTSRLNLLIFQNSLSTLLLSQE